MFSAEVYNVEEGLTNEHFPNERDAVPGCVFNSTLEDYMDIADLNPFDISMFAGFIRLSAPPNPMPMSPSAEAGEKLVTSIGCALCHTMSVTTGASPYIGLNNVTDRPLSDFALHHMGSGLGNAGLDQFRTAPLWGIGQRLFFLHDGRTRDLLQAIDAHSSPHSEANKVIDNFHSERFRKAKDPGLFTFAIGPSPANPSRGPENDPSLPTLTPQLRVTWMAVM